MGCLLKFSSESDGKMFCFKAVSGDDFPTLPTLAFGWGPLQTLEGELSLAGMPTLDVPVSILDVLAGEGTAPELMRVWRTSNKWI